MNWRAVLASALIAALAIVPRATFAETGCPQQFYGGVPPALISEGLAPSTAEICYGEFALLHSGLTRTALWSAERLTESRIVAARQQEREDRFFPELNLPEHERSELADYRGSGWDRGHLAPSADMSDDDSQWQSFSLANIIPQAPNNNRYLWRDIEIEVRKMAIRYGEIYVVTGPLFVGDELDALNGRVYVPTHVFKAVYVPALGAARAYVATNTDKPSLQFMSVAELTAVSGIDVFPALTAEERERPMRLPNP